MGNLRSIQPIKNAKHSQHLSVGSEQRHSQNLPHIEFGNYVQVCPRNRAGIVSPEDLAVHERAASWAFRKYKLHAARSAALRTPTYPESALFQQPNEGSTEPQKIGSSQSELLQEVIKLPNRAQLRGDVQQLVQFVGMRAGAAVQFCIRDRDRAESRHRRDH